MGRSCCREPRGSAGFDGLHVVVDSANGANGAGLGGGPGGHLAVSGPRVDVILDDAALRVDNINDGLSARPIHDALQEPVRSPRRC